MSNSIKAVSVKQPTAPIIPLVIDSPHSSFDWPMDFHPAASFEQIRTGWDAYVDELWGSAPSKGAVLVAAEFPRNYIDPNRNELDIDPELLEGEWPSPLNPTHYTQAGMGLIRRLALPKVNMYDRKLSIAEVEQRIVNYYRPYRQMLLKQVEQLKQQFGVVWHIDAHSMKSKGNAMNADNGSIRPDIVVSDKLGTTADPAFTQWVASELTGLGYKVAINSPYQGGDIVKALGNPMQHVHSIQIEINRGIYMDEQTTDKIANFVKIQQDLGVFLDRLALFINQQLTPSVI